MNWERSRRRRREPASVFPFYFPIFGTACHYLFSSCLWLSAVIFSVSLCMVLTLCLSLCLDFPSSVVRVFLSALIVSRYEFLFLSNLSLSIFLSIFLSLTHTHSPFVFLSITAGCIPAYVQSLAYSYGHVHMIHSASTRAERARHRISKQTDCDDVHRATG